MRSALKIALFLLGLCPFARAQSSSDLEEARKLFGQAFVDEKAGKCPDALEKYKRVQAVKDTANVRFRIGSCSEKLGQYRAAMRAYDGAIRLGRGDPESKDVIAEAQKHIEDLAPRMGRVRLHKPEQADVKIDGEAVLEPNDPVWLDPGSHTISASAPSSKSWSKDVTVRERAIDDVDIVLEPEVTTPPPRPQPVPSHARAIVGWSLVGLGGALGVASVISIIVRETAIASITDQCKMGCPIEKKNDLVSTRDRALVAGPLAGIFAGAAGVAIVTGAILILTQPKSTNAAIVPWIGPNVAGASVTRSF